MLKAMADKVLVVGAGMTGAAVACYLRQNLKKSVIIWDKSLGIGIELRIVFLTYLC